VVPSEYDDGGFSGGNMERPGLKKLLADIAAKTIDTVVVYKVDRLTRSLADFAKIVESFDSQNVSFVSVTQQFNTTTSMGRLTLNVLLSFAQFEREVTGERIRDKVAASKKKGMWMGGYVPLGYDLDNRQLAVNPEEAEAVRMIFCLYIDTKNVTTLYEKLKDSGIHSKRWTSSTGRQFGGAVLSRARSTICSIALSIWVRSSIKAYSIKASMKRSSTWRPRTGLQLFLRKTGSLDVIGIICRPDGSYMES
jgi:site-specific DNA recombinase